MEVRAANLTHIHRISHVAEDASRNIYRVVETSPIIDEERELLFILLYRLDAFYGFPGN